MRLISVVIVNYRSGNLVRTCLESLIQSMADSSFEILIINNDSVENLSPVLTREWPHVRVIQNTSNLGFSAAANQGFRQSRGEFVLLLNPDVQASPGSVDALVSTLDAHEEAGIVLSQLRNADGSLQYSCRRFYTFGTLLLRRGPWKRFFIDHPKVQHHLMKEMDHQSLAPVDWGLGAAMLVRRSVIPGQTLFDERFFLYFEDVDLCLRLHRAGWRVLYNPASVMIHEHRRDSARPLSLMAKRHHFVSLMKFLLKYRFRLGMS